MKQVCRKKDFSYAIQLTEESLEHFKKFCVHLDFTLKDCGICYEVWSSTQMVDMNLGDYLVIFDDTDQFETYSETEFKHFFMEEE